MHLTELALCFRNVLSALASYAPSVYRLHLEPFFWHQSAPAASQGYHGSCFSIVPPSDFSVQALHVSLSFSAARAPFPLCIEEHIYVRYL